MSDFLSDDDVEEMLPRPRLESSVIVDDGRYAGGADFNKIRARLLDLREGVRSGGGVPLADGSTTPRPMGARLAEDRNPLDFGAVADGVTDCSPAFEAIFASFGPPAQFGGARIKIPPGTYRMSRTLRVTRHVVIEGSGGSGEYGATTLLFDAGVPGIVVDRHNTSPDGGRGDWSVIRDLGIRAASKAGAAHGVTLHARAELYRIFVLGFSGNGIHIDADINYDPGTNANNWRVDGARVLRCGGHGLYTRSGDSNAGVCIGLDATDNGGWGVYEGSFLGNTYVACHADSNALGAYRADSPNGYNVFVGCYSEGGQPTSAIEAPSLVLGGIHAAGLVGTGTFIVGGLSKFGPIRADIGGTQRALRLGNADGVNSNAFLGFDVGGTQRFQFRYLATHPVPGMNTRNAFLFGWSNAHGQAHFGLAGEVSEIDVAMASGYQQWCAVEHTTPLFSRTQGHYSGGSHVVHRDAIPDAGTWNLGDIIYNRQPTPGGSIGWVCTTAGTLGTYSEGLTATATGAKTITLSAATTVLAVGMVVTVGAKLSRVQAIDGVTVTMLDNIPTGSGLAIAFSPPVLKTFGSISA